MGWNLVPRGLFLGQVRWRVFGVSKGAGVVELRVAFGHADILELEFSGGYDG